MCYRNRLVVCLLTFSFINFASAEVADKVVAIVGSDVITKRELDKELVSIYDEYLSLYQGSELERMLEEARLRRLERMIEDRLILQEAKRRGIEVTDEELDEKLLRAKEKFVTERDFISALEEEGLTLRDLKQRYTEQIMVAKLVSQEVNSKVYVFPQDIAAYYQSHLDEFDQPEEVRVRKILIRVQGDTEADWAEARGRANEFLDKLRSGAGFEEAEGGDMDFIQRGEMRDEIEEAIFSLKVGEATDPVKTKLGYYIFKVEEKIDERQKGLSEVCDEIRDALFKERFQTRYKEWMEKLKENAYISIK